MSYVLCAAVCSRATNVPLSRTRAGHADGRTVCMYADGKTCADVCQNCFGPDTWLYVSTVAGSRFFARLAPCLSTGEQSAL